MKHRKSGLQWVNISECWGIERSNETKIEWHAKKRTYERNETQPVFVSASYAQEEKKERTNHSFWRPVEHHGRLTQLYLVAHINTRLSLSTFRCIGLLDLHFQPKEDVLTLTHTPRCELSVPGHLNVALVHQGALTEAVYLNGYCYTIWKRTLTETTN